METIEQPGFDNLATIDQQNVVDTGDRSDLIESSKKKKKTVSNGDSPTAESSPLHSENSTSILCSPQNYGLRVIIVSSIVFSLAVTVALIMTIYLVPDEVNGNAAVVAGDQRCADIGLKTLKDGGNAVDAAVSAAFCLAVVEPQHSGLGGGGFAIVHDHKYENSYGFDFRETAPAAFDSDAMKTPDFDKSVLSVGVPGMLKGLSLMHSQHGDRSWKDLVQPSVELAQNGFAVSKELASSLQSLGNPKTFPALKDFLKPNGQWKTENDTVTLKFLGLTLKDISEDRDILYTGSYRKLFVQDVKAMKGIIEERDLENYTVVQTNVLQSKLRDLTVLSLPPPSMGPLLGLAINMAQVYIPETDEEKVPALAYHKMIETFKFAFGQMSLLGDPAFEKTVPQEVKRLLSQQFAKKLVGKIGNRTHSDPSFYGPGQTTSRKSGTSQLSVLDSSELMVSISLSTGDMFGNGLVLPASGIFLNNNLAQFSAPGSSADDRNRAAPGKRPQSSMCPIVVYNKDHPCDQRLVIGATHGTQVLSGLAQMLIKNILYEQKMAKALSAPRLHNQLYPNYTLYENNFPTDIIQKLEARGHDLRPVEKLSSQVTGIRKSNDDITPGLDPRSLSAEAHY